MLFGLAIVTPVLIFSGLVLARYNALDRAQFEERVLDVVEDVAFELDQQLGGVISTLQALASSPSLQNGDLASFYLQANAVVPAGSSSIILTDPSGQEVVNTRVPWGAALPTSANPLVQRDLSEIKIHHVSDLFSGAISGRTVFAISVPVARSKEVRYILSMAVSPDRFEELFDHYNVPTGWVVAIEDRPGKIVARSQPNKEFASIPVAAREAIAMSREPEAARTTADVEGREVLFGCRRSKLANWVACAMVPMSVVEAPFKRGWWIFASWGGGLLSLSFVLAFGFGRRLAAPIQIIANQAAVLGSRGALEPIISPVHEANNVSSALCDALVQIRQRTRELEESRQALADNNRALEARVAERTSELYTEMERRQAAQSALVQAQKMEALGRLVSGVAHDFNNLLTVITANLEMLEPLLKDDKSHRLLHRANQAADVGARLVGRLLAVARRQELTPEITNLNDRLVAMTELLKRTLGEEVTLQTVLAHDLWPVRVDASQVESAVLNLAVNARDAMPNGGKLVLETCNVSIDNALATAGGLVRGEYVLVSVSDTGIGMSPDVLRLAFEPFFTTKKPGKGTGLGLATIYGFVKQSGGHVTIHSGPGQGTAVKIYLPRVQNAAMDSATTNETPDAEAGHGEIVLVVEDNEAVRETTVCRLEGLGFRVIAAEGGSAAVELLQSGREIDLVFSDVVMAGGMSGYELAQWMCKNRLETKILLTSGFVTELARASEGSAADLPVLRKPYSRAELVNALRAALATSYPPSGESLG
jgi:signal transduction histidine kinase/CheY-like chemotaxis protein